MKNIFFILLAIIAIGAVVTERLYVSHFEERLVELEKQRIVTSNKLATAKIVSENLNHVRDLVFKNMEFRREGYTSPREDNFFSFLTTCVNDLKMDLVKLKPLAPQVMGRVVAYPYELEFEGDFFKFGELCAKFENSHRIISVESFEIALTNSTESQFAGQGGMRPGLQAAFAMGSAGKAIHVTMRVHNYSIRKSS